MDSKSFLSVLNIIVFYITIVSSQENNYDSCSGNCSFMTRPPIKLDFSPSEVYFRHKQNVLCLDKSRLRVGTGFCDFRLTGCLRSFASSERTQGVCTFTNQTEVDLFLDVSRMEEGLYDFGCYLSPGFISNYAVVVNGSGTYKDILIFVNDAEASNDTISACRAVNSTGKVNLTSMICKNVNIIEGYNLTIMARNFGDQGIIGVYSINATGSKRNISETRFDCSDTGIPCDSVNNELSGSRYRLCKLLGASVATDNQTLLFYFQYNGTGEIIELGGIKITVNSTPATTTTIITNSPMPTDLSPTKRADGTNNTAVVVAVAIILVVIILAIIMVILLIGLCHYFRVRRSCTDKTNANASQDGLHIKKMKVLMHTCACDHINVKPLVSKLKRNNELDVKELTVDTSSSLNDKFSKLYSEMNQHTALVDCSCPGGYHSNMQTVVKSFTQRPTEGDPNISKWRIIQLNKCNLNPETSPQSWSKLFGFIDAIDYSDIGAIVDVVERKLIEYSQSRTSSIHSFENEMDTCQLLDGQHSEEKPVGAPEQNKILIEVSQKLKGVSQKLDGISNEQAERHEEIKEKLIDNDEILQEVITQGEAIGKDTRNLVNNREDSK